MDELLGFQVTVSQDLVKTVKVSSDQSESQTDQRFWRWLELLLEIPEYFLKIVYIRKIYQINDLNKSIETR